MALTAIIKSKIGTTEEWEKSNRILARGEIGIEVNSTMFDDREEYLLKVGDGKTPFKRLNYCNGYQKLADTIAKYDHVVNKTATQESDGLMSKEDKEKLDNMVNITKIDKALDANSENVVMNSVVTASINDIEDRIRNTSDMAASHVPNKVVHITAEERTNWNTGLENIEKLQNYIYIGSTKPSNSNTIIWINTDTNKLSYKYSGNWIELNVGSIVDSDDNDIASIVSTLSEDDTISGGDSDVSSEDDTISGGDSDVSQNDMTINGTVSNNNS
jgi:hypothetical protein